MDFLLDPDLTFLNHGSYGACPAPVFEAYQAWQRELERNPVQFLARRFEGLLGEARAALAAFVGARAEDLVFVPNATSGLNAVIRSLRLEPGDEVLTTRHEYGAVAANVGVRRREARPRRAGRARCVRSGRARTSSRSSHITSPTALVLPVAEVCAAARAAGVLSIVDGAHAPGQLPLDLEALGADIYAGNCHKWLCAPKGAGFLWARPEHQHWIAPLVISWGYGAETSFAERHGWQGTRDPAAYLAVPAAIEAHATFDLERCRRIAASFHDRLPPVGGHAGAADVGDRAAAGDAEELQCRLFDEHGIEVPVKEWEGGPPLLRVSIAPYNEPADVERLLDARTHVA